MKRNLLILITPLLMLLSSNAFAEVQAIFNYKQFQIPGKGIYIENYLSFVSSSLKYKIPTSDKLQARLLVTQLLKKNDSIVDFKKYNVLGPVLIDSVAVDFKDQQRFFVESGLYELEIQIQDLNGNSKPIVLNKFINIKPYDLQTNISDIEIIDYLKKTEKKNDFSKSGYDIYPMVSNYIPTEVEKLAFYYEIYNKNKFEKVLIKEYIETFYGSKLLPSYINRSVKKLNSVTPIIHAFNIKKLPTGNYNLVVELRDSNNKLITKEKVFIQRVNVDSKPVVVNNKKEPTLTYGISDDSLDYFLGSLVPIANTLEYTFLTGNLDKFNDTLKDQYFINFWQTRYGVDGVSEWEKYRAKVKEVEQRFGTKTRRGYETDMGRVFIKYGKPNDIIEKLNEQGTYPYAIWHYYQTQNRSNVIFVFYHTTAVAREFELIHSDMPGEITNRDWKYLVNMRVGGKDNRVEEDARRMR